MFKRSLQVLMALALILLLAGCAAKSAPSYTTPKTPATKAAATTESLVPAETAPATEAPIIEIPQETVAAEPEVDPLSYCQYIDRCDQSVYGGPGYDYGFVDTVRTQGEHIIVEEAEDYEGNLWGRLESGAGWVDLTQIRAKNYDSSLISANYADENLLTSGAYFLYRCNREYSIPIAFRAYGKLRDFSLFPLEFRDDGLYPGSDLMTLEELTPEKPLVAELDFPGDMTTYGIRFTDETNVSHVFQISMSGRNGALELAEVILKSDTLPYLLPIERCDQSLYSGPGYDYGFAGTVRVEGTYTIVEEVEDYEGNLWGRLKSGAGWVDLTQIRTKNYDSSLISANYADNDLLASGTYFHYCCDSEYSIPITFRTYGNLQNVTLFDVAFGENGYSAREDLLTLPELTPETPLVAELDFPGDMTTYGIRFTDEAGTTHVYYICISGRNGSLILSDN